MKAIIIAIGDELISGQTVDTNSSWLSRELAARGIASTQHICVGDSQNAIAATIEWASRHADLVIVSGGLGPTADDLTRQALAQAMGTPLVLDQACLEQIEAFFRSRGRSMNDANRIQAMVPQGADPLDNPAGTAPGLAARLGDCQLFVVPGVPYEMQCMFERHISPHLGQAGSAIVHHIVHTFGAGESDVGAHIADLMTRGANPTVGTTVAAGLVSIRVIARAADKAAADALAGQTIQEIRHRLGELVIGVADQTMASAVGEMLTTAGQSLATAESCTGGMIGQMLTAVPGSSRYYLGGVICYANSVKSDLLDVEPAQIQQHGAVSEAIALAMAEGCRNRFASDWAISVTGVAGPGGGTDAKPVGLVYVGLAGPGGISAVRREMFPGTREIIRLRAGLAALNQLRLAILKLSSCR